MNVKNEKTMTLLKWAFVSMLAVALWSGCGAEQQAKTEVKGQDQTPIATSSNAQKAISESVPKKTGKIKVTFVELGSVRCIPCKMMKPIMDAVEKDYAGQVKVVFHDVWTPEGRPAAEKYGIQAIPTQVFLDSEGKEYFRHAGFFPKEELVKVLQQKGVK